MKIKSFIGWSVLLFISLLPAVIWYFFRENTYGLTSYADLTHAIGQLSGLIGMTMFALTFVLATRFKFIEDTFGGLDKVYIVHSIMGGVSFVLILIHPLFLVLKFVPQNINLAATYLLPTPLHISINLGIIAFISMILLLSVTFYFKIKYNIWKMSHKFLGFVFIFACLHIFLIRDELARDNIFTGYYIYVAIVSLIGISAFIFTLLVSSLKLREVIYKIDLIERNKNGLHSLVMTPVYKPLKYNAGQFIFLKIYNRNIPKESHPFSIASKSNDEKIRIVIKELGDFTSRLDNLKIGDRVGIEGPYGRFNKQTESDKIWIAAGIGITPFLGMAEDLKKDMKSKVDLYYTVKSKEDFVLINRLKSIEANTNGKFRVIPWISNEAGRLSVDSIKEISKSFSKKEISLCGPTEFKNAMKIGLKKFKVPDDKIFEEEFNFK